MFAPGDEADLTLHQNAQAFVGIGLVTRDAREELRHQAGVVERLFLLRAQVSLGTAHPKRVAVEDDFLPAQRLAVIG